MQQTTLGEHLQFAERAFRRAKLYFGHGTNNSWDEAVAIARYVLRLKPDVGGEVINRILTTEEKESFHKLIELRIKKRKPVPYLTQEAWFAGKKYFVDERVIIPRSPFGELITKQFKPWLTQQPNTILDLCTGSGCIAIACADQFPNANIIAMDISEDALTVAKKNVTTYHLNNRIQLIKSDLFQNCPKIAFDLILSNPPYVDAEEMKNLPQEFHHEPQLALAAGRDGLDIADKILAQATPYLNTNGLLLVEVGYSENALVAKYPNLPFTWMTFEQGGEGVFMLSKEALTNYE